MRLSKWLIILVFAIATLLRFGDSLRPVNGSSWRESDMASIARNFAVEGMDPRFPRIDWRDNGPGFVEMEFPFTSWITALTYKVFGIHAVLGRIWSFIFSVITLGLFLGLARQYLGTLGSLFALTFFAFNPLVIDASSAFKPEAFMLMAYVAAVYFFVKWQRDNSDKDLVLAAVMTALALLAKATAGHIGILFAVVLIQKHGIRFFVRPRIWLFGAITILPAAAWYVHAKSLWLKFGNSLGVSNEYHWVGWDFFTNPYFIKGIFATEFIDVWVIFGLAAAVFALVYATREKLVKLSLIWIASIFVMYIAAARTTADDWASYYHIFAVAPAALLFGFGLQEIKAQAKIWADSFSQRELVANLMRLAVLALVAVACGGALMIEAVRTRSAILEHRLADPDVQFARSLEPKLKSEGLVLVSGGSCFDEDGYPVAYNKSYMFYALGRKGSNICVEDQTLGRVESFAGSGYVYFVAQRMEMDKRPGFAEALSAKYKIEASNGEYTVFALDQVNSNELPAL